MTLFRVVRGIHVEAGPPDCPCDRCQRDRDSIQATEQKNKKASALAKKRNEEFVPQVAHTVGHIYRSSEPGNNIVNSSSNLLRLNQPGAIKFELIDESGRLVQEPVVDTNALPKSTEGVSHTQGLDHLKGNNHWDTIRSMNESQLKKFAAEEEIDLGKASSKADMLEVIKRATVTQ